MARVHDPPHSNGHLLLKSKPNRSWICIRIQERKMASIQNAYADPSKAATHFALLVYPKPQHSLRPYHIELSLVKNRHEVVCPQLIANSLHIYLDEMQGVMHILYYFTSDFSKQQGDWTNILHLHPHRGCKNANADAGAGSLGLP